MIDNDYHENIEGQKSIDVDHAEGMDDVDDQHAAEGFEDVQVLGEPEESEDDENIADRIKLRRRSSNTDSGDTSTTSGGDSTSSTTLGGDSTSSTASAGDVFVTSAAASTPLSQSKLFISKLLTLIKGIAPAAIYSKSKYERRRKKVRIKKVHPELQDVWRNVDNIFPSDYVQKEHSIFPSVDWTKVNERMIKNIPAPFIFSIHGVSEDPEFCRWMRRRPARDTSPTSSTCPVHLDTSGAT